MSDYNIVFYEELGKLISELPYLVIKQSFLSFFFTPKHSPKSTAILLDRSRSVGLFRKAKTHVIAKFHRTDIVICSHSRERKTLSYSR